ncbi:Uncharacterised protein [BD1-7 clade bacterium]|uniref:AttH domain-containing protein n=1 Tax=BD1-7 clade bacterium TaxID=2029982 RepID=A0A5S9PPR6_9GAMM|nr:Uncharacterised protein [BD1-7 clade bacterium]
MSKKSFTKASMVGASVALSTLLTGCFESYIPNPFNKPVLGDQPAHYEREGMNADYVEAWEDGLRTDMTPGHFEWWYFDAELTDGTKIVVVFHTKSMFAVAEEASPRFTIDITPPGQDTIKVGGVFEPEEASFSEEGFNLTMGPNFGYGDLDEAVIHAEFAPAGIAVDFTFNRIVPSWRPANGHWYFNKNEDTFFAWLPSMPKAEVTGSLTVQGQTVEVSGSGYHDHNWGNAGMDTMFSNWWWSRGDVDGKVVLASELRTRPAHASQKMPIMMVADETNGLLADAAREGATFSLTESNVIAHPDPASPETIAHTLNFAYTYDEDSVELTLNLDTVLNSTDLLEISDKSEQEKDLARALGIDPWYSRIFSNATLNYTINGEEFEGEGFSVMEKMDFE